VPTPFGSELLVVLVTVLVAFGGTTLALLAQDLGQAQRALRQCAERTRLHRPSDRVA
jgi:Sec-independent protein translocase protein TatA